MSVNFELLRTVEPMAVSELEKLHTGSLLTRFKELRALQECFDKSDWTQEDRDAVESAGLIAFKDSERWRKAYAETKKLLDKREHLPRGSKQKRQASARKTRKK